LPAPTYGSSIIALAWNDLNPSSGGSITYSVQGTAPNRIFIISYNGVPNFGSATPAVTGQIALHEGTGIIEIITTNIITDGSNGTQGIADATSGLPVPGFNATVWNAANQAYTYVPTPSGTFTWTPATGLSATNISNPVANPASTTTYTVSVTIGACTATQNVTVTVGLLPLPTASSVTICPNTATTLSVTGQAGANFTWYNAATGGTVLSTSATYTTPVLNGSTTYYVEQQVGLCTSLRLPVVVTLGDITPPVIAGCPSNINVVAASPACTAVATWVAPTATDNCAAPPTSSMSTIATSFASNSAAIAATVPSQFIFTLDGGVTGTQINDGGNDMYDGGNTLNTNLGTNIPYTNNVITPSAAFGTGGSYFTNYASGLFMMNAQLGAGVTSFNLNGNNGADGNGLQDSRLL
jgi:hypothetical protein